MRRRWIVALCVLFIGFGFLLLMLTNNVHDRATVYSDGNVLSTESRLPASAEAVTNQSYYHLKGLQWMVTASSAVLTVCVGALLLLLVVVASEAYLRHRNVRALEEIRCKYLAKLQCVCREDVEDMTTDEIGQFIGYQPRRWRDWEMLQWYAVFMELASLMDCDGHNYTNVRRAMNLVGFTDYVEHQLVSGKPVVQLKMMEAVLLTNMRLSEEVATALYNAKNPKLRKASRIYKVYSENINPYTCLRQEKANGEVFTEWDIMQMCEFYRRANNGNRQFRKQEALRPAGATV